MLFRKHIWKSVRTLVMLVLSIAMIYPFIWMLVASFTSEKEIFKFPFSLIPDPINWDGYKAVWTNPVLGLSMWLYFWNSVKTTLIAMAGALITCTLAGYAYARIKFPGRDFIFLLMLATMMIPTQVVMLPNFMIFKELGLVNTHAAIWLGACFGSPFGTFLCKQYFSTLPYELNESAEIDGASNFRIFMSIMIPLAKPILATLVIFNFLGYWNNYEGPLIYLRSPELYTLPLALKVMSEDKYFVQYAGVMAGSVSAALPLLIVFIAAQKFFIQGVTIGSVKG
ncbi:carbohydrate ABC transporter permease [Paenibacillus eucommiae]|uniref:Multiple sugar transport system permease protein n=1 Tax=Paenibacillus eucommiae TaxID=1355755 RepID=A0ABS4IRT8_9BACL|nr:carbohydrate ABC transporter permease [Paenibacillus eucommiae]MBP1990253.1 multiple sugar transport system permease protein [Paenibacillus eucommiae]